MRARHCHECAHFVASIADPDVCGLGHRPRFYMPRDPPPDGWGWKRRCEDFKDRNDEKSET